MKFLWNKSCFFATIFVFLLIAIISNITLNIQFLEPFGKALSDFKLTDIVYSKLRPEQPIDTNIVLINTGEFPKKKIGEMILAIAPHKPKVIGIDHFLLLNSQDPESDSIVAKALATAGNVTLVSKLTGWNEDAGRWDSLIHSPQVFSQYTTSGFANVITQDFRTVRIVTPIESVGSAREVSFPVRVAQGYDSAAAQTFLKRNNKSEIINYRGNWNYFLAADTDIGTYSPEELEFLRGKIVLFGYLGRYLGDTLSLEDKFFTPMNPQYAGHTDRDMYGLVIHANVISMILNGSFITELPQWLSILIAVIICYGNMLIFKRIYEKYPNYFELISAIILLIEPILLLVAMISVFLYFNISIDLTVAVLASFLSANSLEIYLNLVEPLPQKVQQRISRWRKKSSTT
ncbi:MAG: CHASE2 domain-containing protein [Candidatus Kapaibacterium sp.]